MSKKEEATSSSSRKRRSERREFLRRASVLSANVPAVNLLFAMSATPNAVQAQVTPAPTTTPPLTTLPLTTPPLTTTMPPPPPPPTTVPPPTTPPPPGTSVSEPGTVALIGTVLAGWALLRRNVRAAGLGLVKRWWSKL